MVKRKSNYRKSRYNKKLKTKKANTKARRMTTQERKMQLYRTGIVFVLLLCVLLLVVMVVNAMRSKDLSTTQKAIKEGAEANNGAEVTSDTIGGSAEIAEAITTTPTPVQDVKIVISAIGDCTLGTDKDFDNNTNFDTMYDNVGGASYFFQNVKSIFEQDDITIANLEGALTTSEDEQEKTFAFKGRPEYVDILKEGSIEAVNIANNHSRDFGQQGLDDTIANVSGAGIDVFGYDRVVVKEIKGAKVGLVGIYVLADEMERATQLKDKIAEVKAQGARIIIVSFHWGAEKANYPNRVQQDLGRMAIDEGADLVIGHHPHVLQGIEKYNGKNIVYSLGNFCFGGNSNPSDKDTMIFQQTFTIQGGTVVQDDVVNIIPCSISSESGYNNYQPTPLEGEEKTRVENKIKEFSDGIGD